MADVTHEFSLQVGYGSKHATGNDITLDLGEPQLDLVKPGRIGWGEMPLDVGMCAEEGIDLLGLVRREVIGDHMNLLALGLVGHDVGEEGDELGRGVARGGFAQHLTGLGVKGGIERQRAVPVVLEPMMLGASRRQRPPDPCDPAPESPSSRPR